MRCKYCNWEIEENKSNKDVCDLCETGNILKDTKCYYCGTININTRKCKQCSTSLFNIHEKDYRAMF
jgi:hypothetical protein